MVSVARAVSVVGENPRMQVEGEGRVEVRARVLLALLGASPAWWSRAVWGHRREKWESAFLR